jgi:hypothetical protein
MTFSRRLKLKRTMLGPPFSNRCRQNQTFQTSGPLILAGNPLEYPLGRAEVSCLPSAFRPVILQTL